MDFFDLKGVVEAVLQGLHVGEATFKPARRLAYYPGRTAELQVGGQNIGVMGQLHPAVVEAYAIKTEADWPVLAADFDLDALLSQISDTYVARSVPRFPPVQQDIAVIVDEAVPAAKVQELIVQTGQPLLTEARLFDIYRGEQIGPAKKSLAFSLTFQSEESTLTDKVVARRQRDIVTRLERELGAKLRS
jgi:phenylalanyl-tRNA synthetase beta chain